MNPHRSRLGFRDGERGTHTSRTIMTAELRLIFEAFPADATREDYRRAVIEDNVLGKRTGATRKLSFQRLSELYGLDPKIALFRYFRFLWDLDREGRPLIAFLCAYARDPLLRMSAPAVLEADEGANLGTADLAKVLAKSTGTRFNESILNKIACNAGSSWTQSGHLAGRAHKRRTQPRATPGAAAMALFLGYLEGFRAQRLFDTPWVRLLEVSKDRLHELAREARRRGWLDYLCVDTVVEVRFPGRLTAEEEEWTHEPG